VISAGKKVDTVGKELLCGLLRQPETTRRVFAVRDTCVDCVLVTYERYTSFERIAAWRADDITDDEQIERS